MINIIVIVTDNMYCTVFAFEVFVVEVAVATGELTDALVGATELTPLLTTLLVLVAVVTAPVLVATPAVVLEELQTAF